MEVPEVPYSMRPNAPVFAGGEGFRAGLLGLVAALLLPLVGLHAQSNKDNIVTRTYHDITARDNAYFNAQINIQETEEKLWEDQKDNYEEVLPVFKYGPDGAGKSAAGAMDEVIKKCSFPITLHKNSKWVDDAYFLIGKAHFYKQDYDKALESFQYLISEYDEIDKKKSKSKSGKKRRKKRSKGKSSKSKDNEDIPSLDRGMAFLYHHKRSPEAALWVARCLIELGRYADAQTAISVIRGEEEFPKALQGELESVQAHLLLKQNKYALAVAPLRRSTELTKSRQLRARYTFILAQIQARTGQPKDAIETYEAVLKLRPDYEMEFFAQINMANILLENKLRSGKEIKDMLADLLKDEKNRDYFGLIYYAMADIDLAAGNEESGIENLNLSVRNSGNDAKQQAISYLRLADLRYEAQDFKPAFYYYDSCLASLPAVHERKDEAQARRDGLEGLVDYLKTIETEERLQHWASLPEKARDAEIEEWLEETRGPQEEEEEEFLDPFDDGRGGGRNQGGSSVVSNGKWYFYDDGRRGAGFSAFRARWGKRENTDNWRRSDKRSTVVKSEEEQTASGADGGPIDLDNLELQLDDILASLPTDSAGKATSNQRIGDALYEVAVIYKDYLKNDEKATAYFKDLLERFPQTEHRLQTAYQLYRILPAPQNEPYKRIVLDEFPESLFAKVIEDPDYFDRLERKDDAVKNYYATTYDLYEAEHYSEVLQRVQGVDSLFTENPIRPEFALLGAMVFGETDSVEVFKQALQAVVNDYPGTDQAVRAQELLNHLRLGSVIQRAEEAKQEYDYELDPSVEHFVALVVYETGRNAAAVKTKVSDFNRSYYSNDGLRVSSLLFESNKTIILIKTFPNLDRAMKYYKDFNGDKDVFQDMDPDSYALIAVSRTNYTSLYRKKDLDGYIEFFGEFYLTDN